MDGDDWDLCDRDPPPEVGDQDSCDFPNADDEIQKPSGKEHGPFQNESNTDGDGHVFVWTTVSVLGAFTLQVVC